MDNVTPQHYRAYLMPPLPNVPNVFRTRLLFTINGKESQGVRFFNRWTGTSPTGTAAATLAGLIQTAATDHFPPLMHPSVHLQGTILEDLSSDMGATGEDTNDVPGERTSHPALPADVAFVTGYEIARRYRGGRPKTFWPFGNNNDLASSNSWKATVITEFTTGVKTFLAAVHGLSSGGCTIGPHVNVGYYHGFHVVTNPSTGRARNVPTVRTTPKVTDVTSVVGRAYIGSARRRRINSWRSVVNEELPPGVENGRYRAPSAGVKWFKLTPATSRRIEITPTLERDRIRSAHPRTAPESAPAGTNEEGWAPLSSKIYTYGMVVSGLVATGTGLIMMRAPHEGYTLILKSILCLADGFTWTKFSVQLTDPHATTTARITNILGFDWLRTSGPIPNGGTLNWGGTLPLRPDVGVILRTFHGAAECAIGYQILEWTPGFTPYVPPSTGG